MRGPAGYHLPSLSKTNKVLIVICIVLFFLHQILTSLGAISLIQELGITGNSFFRGKIYQLITYPFIETQFLSLLFNLLMLWFMGSEFEYLWGRKIYLKFLALITVIPGLTYALLGGLFFGNTSLALNPLHGLMGINLAFCVAQATLNPDRVFSFFFVFPLRAIHFCFILVAIEIYSAVVAGQLMSGLIHLESMGLGFMVIKFQTHFLLKWYFQGTRPKFASKGSSHLKLVKKNDQKDPPKYWH